MQHEEEEDQFNDRSNLEFDFSDRINHDHGPIEIEAQEAIQQDETTEINKNLQVNRESTPMPSQLAGLLSNLKMKHNLPINATTQNQEQKTITLSLALEEEKKSVTQAIKSSYEPCKAPIRP